MITLLNALPLGQLGQAYNLGRIAGIAIVVLIVVAFVASKLISKK